MATKMKKGAGASPPHGNRAEDPESARLAEVRDHIFGWRRWGPYLSERSWGTVREDYSQGGDAWRSLSYEQARAKAYRWGEDGIAGICDRYQLLCFAPAFWNGRDPHLKERLFGVTAWEGNHGEDVKEYYYHSDNTPTHSYMRYLYKYPQQEYPYRRLIEENRRRAGQGPEFELLDTGIFDRDRYWDITIEYAKATPEDLCIRIAAANRGPEDAVLHVLPHLWFRNIWSWGARPEPEPRIETGGDDEDGVWLIADDGDLLLDPNIPVHYRLGRRGRGGRGRDLLGAAVAHDDDAVGERQRLVLAVGDEECGDAEALLQVADLLAQALAEVLVEAGEGLVEQQNLRLEDEGAGEGDALLLAAGELVGHALAVAGEADLGEGGVDAAGDLVLREPAELQAEGDVPEDVHVGPEGVALEDHAGRALLRGGAGDVLAVDGDGARGRGLEAADHPEQRRLAGAGGAEQAHELAVGDGQVEGVDGADGAEGLGDVADVEDGHVRGSVGEWMGSSHAVPVSVG